MTLAHFSLIIDRNLLERAQPGPVRGGQYHRWTSSRKEDDMDDETSTTYNPDGIRGIIDQYALSGRSQEITGSGLGRPARLGRIGQHNNACREAEGLQPALSLSASRGNRSVSRPASAIRHC